MLLYILVKMCELILNLQKSRVESEADMVQEECKDMYDITSGRIQIQKIFIHLCYLYINTVLNT
jgi:hypothetical protein